MSRRASVWVQKGGISRHHGGNSATTVGIYVDSRTPHMVRSAKSAGPIREAAKAAAPVETPPSHTAMERWSELLYRFATMFGYMQYVFFSNPRLISPASQSRFLLPTFPGHNNPRAVCSNDSDYARETDIGGDVDGASAPRRLRPPIKTDDDANSHRRPNSGDTGGLLRRRRWDYARTRQQSIRPIMRLRKENAFRWYYAQLLHCACN